MADGDSKTSKLLTNHEPVSFSFVHFKLVLRAGLENLWLGKGREEKGRGERYWEIDQIACSPILNAFEVVKTRTTLEKKKFIFRQADETNDNYSIIKVAHQIIKFTE